MRALTDPSLLRTRAYVNGAWVPAPEKFEVQNPATGGTIASVEDLGVAGIEAAIVAAKDAKAGWAGRPARERSKILRKMAELMVENADDLATILCAENGKPVAEARGEVLYGASYLEWFAEEAKRLYGDVIPAPSPDKRLIVIKQPIGVVGAITPWNFPNAMIARKVGPALAVGCTVVARPSELTPLSALAMAEIARRAGVPAGVFNVVPTLDAPSAGEALCASPDVAKITFTGSTRVGRILMRQCADHIKKMSLELGGNAPFVVFDDADLEAAVAGAMASKFRNAGQTCVCANRLYIQSGIYDAFADRLAEKMDELIVGDGFESGTTTGPLISAAALEKVEDHIKDIVDNGGAIAKGGQRSPLGQSFFEPTLLTGVTQSMKVAHEETFGPIAPLIKFDREEDALSMVNDSEFGLAGYFFTRDIARAFRFGEAMETGMVGINTGIISSETVPFGGVKQSGLGREGSKYGCDDFVEIKTMCFGGM